MVSLNITIVVQIALFLAFLWGMHRLAFRPTLSVLDARDDQVRRDEEAAAAAAREAARLESRYAEDLAMARLDAAAKVSEVRRQTMDERNAQLLDARRAADALVGEAREAAQRELDEQRRRYDELVPEVLAAMRRSMSLGGHDA